MKHFAPYLILMLVLISCEKKEKENKTLFTLLPPEKTHVHFINKLKETKKFNIIEYLYFNNGGGVAAGDINNDGLTDLYFTSNQHSDRLYLNEGGLKFKDITKNAGVGGEGDWKTGVTMADVNGDGLLDIYVCHVGDYKGLKGRNQLFINQGNLRFKEEAHEYGLDFQGFSTQAAFFDYDMDGDLDMYLLNHSVHTSRSYGGVALRLENDKRAGDRLYRNDAVGGKRVFYDVTSQAGIFSSPIGYGLGVNICDINNDGFPDIYVSNDFHENDYLYINNKDGTFSEQLTRLIAHTSRSSMGNDVGDFNNDGLLDIVVLDMLPDNEKIRKQSGGEDDYELSRIKLKYGYYYQFVRNTLQLNLGGGLFSEIGRLAGVYSTDWSWSPLFCDVDNDGWKDLFITNGIYRRANDLDYVRFLTEGNRHISVKNKRRVPDNVLYEKMPLYPNVNYIFQNNKDLTFTNKAKAWGFETRSYSNGSTYADLDNDGDLDLIVNNINEQAYIFENNAETLLKNHFLSVSFKGKGMNRRGTGARVTLYRKGQIQVAEQFVTRGFMSATSDVLHFGLGQNPVIDSLVVRWPDLSVQTLKNVRADRKIILDIRDAAPPRQLKREKGEKEKLFLSFQPEGLTFRHREDPYTDFRRERLIPHSLSAEGPALAVGDINGDGKDDLFVGGAAGQPAQLFLQENNGTFRPVKSPEIFKDYPAEDVDAVLFDADGDGDKDLYIVHGGNEAPDGSPLLADRLWFNEGNGVFKTRKGALPWFAHNGSCVRPADFDGDGDMDLFVGSRSVPGAYGWSPPQVLLENDGKGSFRDVTEIVSGALQNIGMVTDAAWTDYDKDGDPDLVVVGEWMNVCLFENDNGKLKEVTAEAGLAETSGWWNCVQVADIDRDGDPDIIAGNLGLNTIFKASVKQPVVMYLNDFDNNGSIDQLICSYHQGVSYPIASLDELAAQIPGLKKKYPRYADFGGKTVKDIFGEKIIEHSLLKKAVLSESCLFLNNGKGVYKIKKLPVMVQFSPVRSLLIRDVNLDGKSDIILAGNDYWVRPSLGRYDASYGWCLLGDGKGSFKVLLPTESGLMIKGDARKIRSVEIDGKQYFVVAVNNGNLAVIRLLGH